MTHHQQAMRAQRLTTTPQLATRAQSPRQTIRVQSHHLLLPRLIHRQLTHHQPRLLTNLN